MMAPMMAVAKSTANTSHFTASIKNAMSISRIRNVQLHCRTFTVESWIIAAVTQCRWWLMLTMSWSAGMFWRYWMLSTSIRRQECFTRTSIPTSRANWPIRAGQLTTLHRIKRTPIFDISWMHSLPISVSSEPTARSCSTAWMWRTCRTVMAHFWR